MGGVISRAKLEHAALCLAIVGVFFALNFAVFMEMSAGDGSVRTDIDLSLTSILPLITLALWFCYCVVTASYEAACLKWMLRQETQGFAGFSLGANTWRVYAGYWVWFAIGLASWVTVFVSASLLAPLFAPLAQDESWSVFVGLGVIGAWIVFVTPFALRSAPGNAASIARRKFSYFAGWRVSRDRSAALLGSFITLWLIWIVLFLAIFLGLSLIIFAVIGDNGERTALINVLAFSGLGFAVLVANFALAFLSAGVNARAAIAAIEDGKLDGVTRDVAAVLD